MRTVTNALKTTVLLAGLGGLLVFIGSLFGRGGAIIGLVLGVGFCGFSYWFSDRLAIRAAGAYPVTEEQAPRFYATVRELAERADLPMPKLYVSPSPQPNAFATGRNPRHAAVAITEGMLATTPWEEIRGVLAHELGHVANRDILISSVAAAVATGISFIATMLQFSAFFGGDDDDHTNIFVLLATAIFAPIAAGILQMALSRSREFGADRYGARLIGDGEPLARALTRLERGAHMIPVNVDPAHAQAFIVNPLAGRRLSFASWFRTHPPTEERVRRLVQNEWAEA